ncbi:clustered mitochondria-domain-containing protein [Lipomyces oligophaga]|uniref:clustered mitochondria-domain-containing protein n=1 Tax=Lipomyces oligophaga TaxID=45792 RepID=UPI0034CEA52A
MADQAQDPVREEESSVTAEVVDPTAEDVAEASEMLSLTVTLPHEPGSIKIMVSVHETFNDIRQSILDLPSTVQYTCFSLWFEGVKLKDFLELHSVEGIYDGATLELREEAYNEKEARIHVLKVRDVIGLVSTKNIAIEPLSAGLSNLVATQRFGESFNPSTENLSHPANGFELNSPVDLSEYLPVSDTDRPQCVKSLGLSMWHPPAPNFRLRGHLLYLQVLTLEGNLYHITADLSGFYVSNSTNQKFDPSPKKGSGHKLEKAHSLLVLLEQLSPKFKEELLAWQTELGQREPLTVFSPSNAALAAPWLARPNDIVVADISRSQEQLLLGGTDNLDTFRDWNEDLQSTREMPKTTIQEQILRERLLNKLYFDFSEAATKGAVLIARDEVTAINPGERRESQIYLYNGIFFSYGADGMGTFADEGGNEAARYVVGKDLTGVRVITELDIDGIFPLCTVIVDYCGRRIVAQSPIPGMFRQREDGEDQVVYGSSSIDDRDKVACQKDFAPYFEKIGEFLHLKPHRVWDKEGQSFELATSLETKGLDGADGRKYIIDMYRTTPLDINFIESEGEGYPHRIPVLRHEAVEAWWRKQLREWIDKQAEAIKADGKDYKVVYKSETSSAEPITMGESSVEEPVKAESAEGLSKERSELDNTSKEIVTIEASGLQFTLNPDVFSGQVPGTPEDAEKYRADEADVRAASEFVSLSLIPEFVSDLRKGLSLPFDGTQLSSVLHRRGINMRYMSALLKAIDEPAKEDEKATKNLDSLKSILIQEIIVRASKHALISLISSLPFAIVPYAITHFFNCILGTKLNSEPTIKIDQELVEIYGEGTVDDFSFAKLTAADVQSLVADEAKNRFRYDLQSDWATSIIREVPFMRELSLKLGLQWDSKRYSFDKEMQLASKPTSNGNAITEPENLEKTVTKSHTKSKKKGHSSKQQESLVAKKIAESVPATTFTRDDLLNIVPVVKDLSLRSSLAERALETGRLSIMQGQKDVGQSLLLESLSLHEQIYGVIHPEVARAYSQLSMVFSQLGEKDAAVDSARKAVVIAERTIGLDAADTVLMYLNLSLAENDNGNPYVALAYVRRALTLWKMISSEWHPDAVTTFNNVAIMLQAIKNYDDSLKWFEASMELCVKVFGTHSVNTANLNFQLAQAFLLVRDSSKAVQRMRDAYTYFHKELGAEDENTKQAEKWLEHLTQSAVFLARQEKELEARRALQQGLVNGAAQAVNGSSSSPAVTQTGKSSKSSKKKGKKAKSVAPASEAPEKLGARPIDELVKYIDGE